jgi:hypothetical protein
MENANEEEKSDNRNKSKVEEVANKGQTTSNLMQHLIILPQNLTSNSPHM